MVDCWWFWEHISLGPSCRDLFKMNRLDVSQHEPTDDVKDYLFVVMGMTMQTWPFTFYNDVWAYNVGTGRMLRA